jgi:hypothetical protein
MNLCLIFVNIFEEFEMGYEEIQKGVLFLYDDNENDGFKKQRKKKEF